MQYLLTEEEMNNRVLKSKFDLAEKSLVVARNLIISPEECRRTKYCSKCPIGQLYTNPDPDLGRTQEECKLRGHNIMETLCTKTKNWSK